MFGRYSSENFSFRATFQWFLLAFLAGSVNVGGLLACGRFVSHVTGFATLFGVDALAGRWDAAIGILSVPIFFLLGSSIAAFLVDPQVSPGRRPNYALVMALVALCLVMASLGGYFSYFGEFGEPVRLKRDYFFLALLCGASGLQNSAITLSSGFAVRSTHLTGTVTDLGIGVARAIAHSRNPKLRTQDMKAIWLKVGTFFSFALGGAAGATVFEKAHFLGFLMPAGIAVYAMIVAFFTPAEGPGRSHRRVPRSIRDSIEVMP